MQIAVNFFVPLVGMQYILEEGGNHINFARFMIIMESASIMVIITMRIASKKFFHAYGLLK